MTEEDPALVRARKHVTEVRDFFYHLMTYVFVNAILVVIDLNSGPNSGPLGLDFAFWVIIGWGLGVAGHAIFVFFGEYRVQKLYGREKSRESEER